MQEESQNSKAIISTLVLHTILLGACYFFFIAGQIPTETIEQGGIVINYGTSDEGMGTDYTSTDEPAIGETINNEPVEDPNRPNSTTANVATSDQQVLTQDLEDAPVVNSATNTSNSANTTPSVTPVAPTPSVDSRALFKGKKNNGTGAGDGNGNTPGNQGRPDGSTQSTNYTGNGGNGGGGVSLNLAGRAFITKPKIQDDGQTAGRITVDITVDKNGNIRTAKAGGRGTTISNASLWYKCENAVLGCKLNALATGPEIQAGKVVFTFILE